MHATWGLDGVLALPNGPVYGCCMGAAAEFTKQVEFQVCKRLAVEGFRNHKGGILFKEVAPEVLCWIGMNKADVTASGFEVNLVVGVRHQMVERLLCELLDEPFDPVIPPTLTANIGYLSPADRYLALRFSRSDDVSATVEKLCSLVREVAIPFAVKLVHIPDLVHALQTARFGIPQQTAYRLPVSLMLDGATVQAEDCVRAKLKELGDATDPASARYKRFALKILARLSH